MVWRPHVVPLLMRSRLLPLIVVGLIGVAVPKSAHATSPSFDCNKASTPDEFAICSTSKLAELDNIGAAGFNFVRRRYGTTRARKVGRPLLKHRQACGSNQNCIIQRQIEAVQAYQRLGAPIRFPQWLTNPTPSPQAPPITSVKRPPEKKQTTTGSGFFVSQDGFILTNHHVVDECESITIHDKGLAVVKEVDGANDLALLKIQATSKPASFRTTSPGLGESIFALGFPYSGILGAGINFTGGLISSLSGIGNDSRYLQFTAPVQPGNSGGPLVDANGLVVGVVSARLADIKMLKASGSLPQNVNFAIRGELARGFLKANGVTPIETDPTKQLSASEIANEAQAYTVQIICQ
jgi:S1-C subfamily serine protease